MAKRNRREEQLQHMEADLRKSRKAKRSKEDKKLAKKEKERKKQEKRRRKQATDSAAVHSLSTDVSGWNLSGDKDFLFQDNPVL